jgi:outer membrane lipoprotein-sorting protein
MKTRFPSRLLSTAILTLLLAGGCAQTSTQPSKPASKASPEASAAIASANAAIKDALANKWIWVNTEKFAEEAQAAADKGDNTVAIKLATKAKAEADNAVAQYNYEKTHLRGM